MRAGQKDNTESAAASTKTPHVWLTDLRAWNTIAWESSKEDLYDRSFPQDA